MNYLKSTWETDKVEANTHSRSVSGSSGECGGEDIEDTESGGGGQGDDNNLLNLE